MDKLKHARPWNGKKDLKLTQPDTTNGEPKESPKCQPNVFNVGWLCFIVLGSLGDTESKSIKYITQIQTNLFGTDLVLQDTRNSMILSPPPPRMETESVHVCPMFPLPEPHYICKPRQIIPPLPSRRIIPPTMQTRSDSSLNALAIFNLNFPRQHSLIPIPFNEMIDLMNFKNSSFRTPEASCGNTKQM